MQRRRFTTPVTFLFIIAAASCSDTHVLTPAEDSLTPAESEAAVAVSAAMSLTEGELPPFTADEVLLGTSPDPEVWTPDRSEPSGGVESVSAFGRDLVAKVGIDSDNPTADVNQTSFWRTEGIKRIGDYGVRVHIDLYLDPAWQDRAVRAGFWVAGYDAAGERAAFGIIEFTTAASDQGEIDDAVDRWRIWDGTVGDWIDLGTDVVYGEWVRLEVLLDVEAGAFEHFIGGEPQGPTSSGESVTIGEVFLNHYNYGYETPASGLSASFLDSYDVHWHNGAVPDPQTRSDCMEGGWETFGFRNQGQCIRFVNTGKDSR